MANLASVTKIIGGVCAILVCVACVFTIIGAGGFHWWWVRLINIM